MCAAMIPRLAFMTKAHLPKGDQQSISSNQSFPISVAGFNDFLLCGYNDNSPSSLCTFWHVSSLVTHLAVKFVQLQAMFIFNKTQGYDTRY